MALAACSGGDERVRFAEQGVSLETPPSWSVSGFSGTNSPPRLAAASYPVERDDVEGDCGGHAAVERLPADGAYVVLIDYGPVADAPGGGFTDRLPVELGDGELAEYECFGRSRAFHVVVGGRALQAHVGLGPRADDELRAEALAVLNSVEVEPGRR